MPLSFIFILSNFAVTHAASFVSYPQNKPLPRSFTNLPISNQILAPDGFQRSTTVAGGTFPGPLIAANKGEQFSINVVNLLNDPEMHLGTSIHWHGIFQNGTGYNDGTAFVSQCPITQNNSFLYRFDAQNQAGTFWYHGHYSSQYCDGLRGALVIYDPEDPYLPLYDVDDETTVITLSDWYHIASPVLDWIVGAGANSSLINGLGRYIGGPASDLAVINVEYGKRYRFRLVAMSCDPNFTFSIDGHNMTVIEADGQLTEPLLVDSLQIFAGQRYSIIVNATQPVGNYWIRSLPSGIKGATTDGGLNSAILRYRGSPNEDPTTTQTTSVIPLSETNLHALVNPGAPGVPGYGKADRNIVLTVDSNNGFFYINDYRFISPPVPVLLQILSGAQQAPNIMPNGSVYILEPNQVVEVTVKIESVAGPHPIHLHGNAFDVVRSAGSTTFNYANPVRRDVASAGTAGDEMVFRFVTNNAGPWFLHCHIDWHLNAGFAVVMAVDPGGTSQYLGVVPQSWDDLCPKFDALSPSQLGAIDAYQQASRITTRLLPTATGAFL